MKKFDRILFREKSKGRMIDICPSPFKYFPHLKPKQL